MRLLVTQLSSAAVFAFLGGVALTAVAGAQQYPPDVPPYTVWQPGWNHGQHDARHVILGTVGGFTPYRLTVVHPDGSSQVIDLKNGTAIFPTEQTPSEGEGVAIVGYWSRGTLIASRVILRL